MCDPGNCPHIAPPYIWSSLKFHHSPWDSYYVKTNGCPELLLWCKPYYYLYYYYYIILCIYIIPPLHTLQVSLYYTVTDTDREKLGGRESYSVNTFSIYQAIDMPLTSPSACFLFKKKFFSNAKTSHSSLLINKSTSQAKVILIMPNA